MTNIESKSRISLIKEERTAQFEKNHVIFDKNVIVRPNPAHVRAVMSGDVKARQETAPTFTQQDAYRMPPVDVD